MRGPVLIKTFGCKVNYAESVALLEALGQAGFLARELSAADLADAAIAGTAIEAPGRTAAVIVHSCCVTAEAERKAQSFVRRVRRALPQAALLLTGCAARNPASRSAYETAGARICGFPLEAVAWLKHNLAPDQPGIAGPGHDSEAAVAANESQSLSMHRTRTFIKVQDGCRNCCAYCIVPFVRPYASRPLGAVLDEVQQRLGEGYRELVLTGVNVGHYGMAPLLSAEQAAQAGADVPRYAPLPGQPSFFDLLDAVLAILPEGARLRLSSIEPEGLPVRFFEQMAHPRMCPHLHLPLQSGADAVLAAMGRMYSAREYLTQVERFRAACPDGALTTDILVGYPSETESDFQATLDLCAAAGFERIHGFPFSPRQGTRAAALPQLPPGLAHTRNRRLLAHCRAIAGQRWQRFVGTTAQVLIEEDTPQGLSGHGGAYQIVRIAAETLSQPERAALLGRIVPVRLTAYNAGRFQGEL